MNTKLIDLKEILENARERCPGMPEEIYQFADYVRDNLIMNLCAPDLIGAEIEAAFLDIKGSPDDELPEYIAKNRRRVARNARYILQLLDGLLKRDFAEEIREEMRERLDWNPVRRPKLSDRTVFAKLYPPNVLTAVEWWVSRIQFCDANDYLEGVPHTDHEFGELEIRLFRKELAERLFRKFDQDGVAVIATTYLEPDEALAGALALTKMPGEAAYFTLPNRVIMVIKKHKVTVLVDDDRDADIIWRQPEETSD